MSFESDEARREYFLERLEGEAAGSSGDGPTFPWAEDEDILRLSDPPYYTACPNPFVNAVRRVSRPVRTTPTSRIIASRSPSTSASGRPIPSTGRTATTRRCRTWRLFRRFSTTPEPGDLVLRRILRLGHDRRRGAMVRRSAA